MDFDRAVSRRKVALGAAGTVAALTAVLAVAGWSALADNEDPASPVATAAGSIGSPAQPEDAAARRGDDAVSRSAADPALGRQVPDPATVAAAAAGAPGPAADWLSGAAGESVASGEFGRWRGAEVEIAGAWSATFDGAAALWPLQPDGEFAVWDRDLDIAVGGIWKTRGETWAAAAAGAYDGRWEAQLTLMRDLWGDRPGTLWIRFSHEFNGGWQPWSVRGSEAADFTAAWARYRSLQLRILPAHHLVWAPNDGTDGSLDLDVRQAFPGAANVDAVGVSTYNWWPYIDTAVEFAAKGKYRHLNGAPLGLEAWRKQAAEWGVPIALPEWSQEADPASLGGGGDSPVYVQQLHEWMRTHAGTGPGQLVYEVLFTVNAHGDNDYGLHPQTRMPATAAAYQELW